MLLIPYFKYWRFVLIIVSILIIALSCKSPTKTTPENTQELADCSAPGLTYNQPDSTSCICIDNANWNADSTFCDCTSPYIFNSDSTICHLDTTNFVYNWDVMHFGSSFDMLRDVHIVNENDIWVVGAFDISDSTHLPSYGHYNMAHWDGYEWEYKGLVSTDEEIWSDSIIENNTSYTIELRRILYFTNDNIWVTSNCYPKHWDGENWTNFRLNSHMGFPDSTCVGSDIWSTSPTNIYFSGFNESIIHFDGNGFYNLDIGFDIGFDDDVYQFHDIEGTENGEIIFFSGYDDGSSIILKYQNNTFTEIYQSSEWYPNENDIYGDVLGIDVLNDTLYISSRAGFLKYNYITENFSLTALEQNMFYTNQFRDIIVNNPNDIIMVGFSNNLLFFNGNSWIEEYPVESSEIRNADFNNNILALVGIDWSNLQARIILGTRN